METSLASRETFVPISSAHSLSPPPAAPEPTKAEIAAARRRERVAEKKEAALIAAQDRLLFGVPIEQIIKDEEEEDPDAEVYCICRKPSHGHLMVECSNDACEIQWFHAKCVTEEAQQMKDWVCLACKKDNIAADLLYNGAPGSLSYEDVDMIVPPGEVLRAAAGDVYGLSSWKREWLVGTFGEEAMKPAEENEVEVWQYYDDNGEYVDGEEDDEDEES